MKIAFWNVNKQSNSIIINLVKQFALNNELDILFLFESDLDPSELLSELNKNGAFYYFYHSHVSDFVQIFTRFSTTFLHDISDEHRISCKQFTSPLGTKISFILLHFQSKLFYEGADQNALVTEIRQFIEKVEEETHSNNTIVLGDFNMNPFQDGMIQATGFHSTFDKNTALQRVRIINKKEYKYFYNPMWSFYGEHGKGDVHGSYYNAISKPICYFWNIFDQVLLRPDLISMFNEESLKILTSINGTNLLNERYIINKSISDHLPVEFELNII